jgi:hypothetical protein
MRRYSRSAPAVLILGLVLIGCSESDHTTPPFKPAVQRSTATQTAGPNEVRLKVPGMI